MSSQAQLMEPIPEDVERIAKGSFSKGMESLTIKLRDALEPIYQATTLLSSIDKEN